MDEIRIDPNSPQRPTARGRSAFPPVWVVAMMIFSSAAIAYYLITFHDSGSLAKHLEKIAYNDLFTEGAKRCKMKFDILWRSVLALMVAIGLSLQLTVWAGLKYFTEPAE